MAVVHWFCCLRFTRGATSRQNFKKALSWPEFDCYASYKSAKDQLNAIKKRRGFTGGEEQRGRPTNRDQSDSRKNSKSRSNSRNSSRWNEAKESVYSNPP